MDITPGLYRHFKGSLYRVLGIARHSETEERMVLYHPEGQPDSLWVRPEVMFAEDVDAPDGRRPRFAPIAAGQSHSASSEKR